MAIWDQNRRRALEKLREHLERGLVDEDIIFLLEEINRREYFYTTSSCSGRIGIIHVPPSRKKHECFWIYKSHSPVDAEAMRRALMENREKIYGVAIFKQEPPIIDIAVKRLEDAQKLLSLGRAAGFKNSGVKSYNPKRGYEALVELRSTEKIEAPIAWSDYIIPREYFDRLVSYANENLMRSKQKLRRLYELIKSLRSFLCSQRFSQRRRL